MVSSPANLITTLWSEIELEVEYVDALREVLPEQRNDEISSSQSNLRLLLILPLLCCQAAGGADHQAAPVLAAWQLLYTAAHLLDHAADNANQPGGTHLGVSVNLATGMLTAASHLLCELGNAGLVCEVQGCFSRAVLKMCSGQHVALTQRELTLEQCWHLVSLRSGTFFAAACWAGARLATDRPEHLNGFREFGQMLGELLQVADDVSGLRMLSDLSAGHRWTLPLAYAMTVLPPIERASLQAHLKAAPMSLDTEEEARRCILESGAGLYLAVEAARRRRQAEAALLAAPSSSRETLVRLLVELEQRCVL